jgi:3',5'-cyclic AMP phosphodiesterase CpdA
VRVLFSDVPPLMEGVLTQAVSEDPDVEILSESEALKGDPPDLVVLTGRVPETASSGGPFLRRWPHTPVLMISLDGRAAAIFELRPHRIDLGDRSPADLFQAARMFLARHVASGTDWRM